MTSADLIRHYKLQRRRNARTIRERNETIRRLEAKAEAYREIAEERRFVCEMMRDIAKSLLAERDRLRVILESRPEVPNGGG